MAKLFLSLALLVSAHIAVAESYIAVIERTPDDIEISGWTLRHYDCVSEQVIREHEFDDSDYKIWIDVESDTDAMPCLSVVTTDMDGNISEPADISAPVQCDYVVEATRSDGTRPAYWPGTRDSAGRINEGICCGERDPNSIRITDNWRLADRDGDTVETYCSEQ